MKGNCMRLGKEESRVTYVVSGRASKERDVGGDKICLWIKDQQLENTD